MNDEILANIRDRWRAAADDPERRDDALEYGRGLLPGVFDPPRQWLPEIAEPVRNMIAKAVLEGSPGAVEALDSAAAGNDGDIACEAVPLSEIDPNLPEPVLAVPGGGAVLSVGTVAVLAGEGGIAKSPLALNLALDIAALPQDGKFRPVLDGLFHAPGGPVLMASWEDGPATLRWRAGHLATAIDGHERGPATKAIERLHVLSMLGDDSGQIAMHGRPLFGPDDAGGAPKPLRGWSDLWKAARKIKPCMIVIDPVAAAFVGDGNTAGPVRDFLGKIAKEASTVQTGVLLLAHSTKSARRQRETDLYEPFDPGQVSGSSQWTDGARGALTLTWRPEKYGGGPGKRMLAIAKANYGRAHVVVPVEVVRAGSKDKETENAIVGFKAAGRTWEPLDTFKEEATDGSKID